MSEIKYTRGIPTYTDSEGNSVGMLCETKEKCITDDNGISLETKLTNIIDGTTQVGDAEKLGGHEVEYFANASGYRKWYDGTCTNFDTALTVGKYVVGGTDLVGAPYTGVIYGTLYNETANDKKTGGMASVWLTQIFVNTAGRITYRQNINGEGFTEWKRLFTTDGGTVDGDVTLNKLIPAYWLTHNDGNKRAKLERGADYFAMLNYNSPTSFSAIALMDRTDETDENNIKFEPRANVFRTILHTGNMGDHVLPLTGGMIATESNWGPLHLKNNTQNIVGVTFLGVDGQLGWLGLNGMENPSFMGSNNTMRSLLHTGNKPTGTYTGNGSATARTIVTGGIGITVIISNPSKGIALLTPEGTRVFPKTGGVTYIPPTECEYNGAIQLATTNEILNASGESYTYTVL